MNPNKDYDEVVLSILIYEFDFSDNKEIERGIRETLLEKNLGVYDEDRIALLRRFKDAIRSEFWRGEKSKYYAISHAPLCNLNDFKISLMAKEYEVEFPNILPCTIERFVERAVHLYWLR